MTGAETGEESMGRHQQLAMEAILRQGQLDLGADLSSCGDPTSGTIPQKLRSAVTDMHRQLYDLWSVGETVIVRLALQGSHTGHPLGRR
jgi:hypothetical protein